MAEAFPEFGIHHCGANTEQVVRGYLKVPNLKFLEIGAGSDLAKVSQAYRKNGREDIISCIRYSPVELKSDDTAAMKRKLDDALDTFED